MSISLVGSTKHDGDTAAVTSFSINKPAGVVNGELLLWTIVETSINSQPATPSGWSVWEPVVQSGTVLAQTTFYKFASGEPSSYTVSGLTSAVYSSIMTAYRGVDPSTPKDVANVTANNTSNIASPPAITPVTSGAWVVAIASGRLSSTTGFGSWSSTNMTQDQTAASNLTSAVNGVLVHSHLLWPGGAVTPNEVYSTGGTQRWSALTSALRPDSAVSNAGQFFALL